MLDKSHGTNRHDHLIKIASDLQIRERPLAGCFRKTLLYRDNDTSHIRDVINRRIRVWLHENYVGWNPVSFAKAVRLLVTIFMKPNKIWKGRIYERQTDILFGERVVSNIE